MSAPRRSARIAALPPKSYKTPKATKAPIPQAPLKAPRPQEPKLVFNIQDNLGTLIEISLNHKERLSTCPETRRAYHWVLEDCAFALKEIEYEMYCYNAVIAERCNDGMDVTKQQQGLEALQALFTEEDACELLRVLDETREVTMKYMLPREVESRWDVPEAELNEEKIRKYIKDLFNF